MVENQTVCLLLFSQQLLNIAILVDVSAPCPYTLRWQGHKLRDYATDAFRPASVRTSQILPRKFCQIIKPLVTFCSDFMPNSGVGRFAAEHRRYTTQLV
jgi:hypothetical protein